MAKIDAEKLVDLLRRSGLVEYGELKGLLSEIKAEFGGQLPRNAEKLGEILIDREVITRWQSEKLLEGRHKGFFLGKYKLLGHLGTGGMSSVYLAEHVHMHRRVAVKVLPLKRVEDSSYLERFYLEAKAAAALSHPNIVTAFDIDHEDKIHYLVMEYVDGRDLQVVVREDGPLEFKTAANYIAQAAAGLAHAHEAGLIHRDVKPANLLVDSKGTVKVLDLGLALFSDDSESSLTIAHDETVLGTADYLAPEQAVNSHAVDPRADIYSLGCTLYFLLTGKPPFSEGSLAQRLIAHQKTPPKSILEKRPGAPRDLVGICQQMMIKSPQRRLQTAERVQQLLEQWMETYEPSESSKKLAAVTSGSRLSAAAAGAKPAPPRRGKSDILFSNRRPSRRREPPGPTKSDSTIPGSGVLDFSGQETVADSERSSVKGKSKRRDDSSIRRAKKKTKKRDSSRRSSSPASSQASESIEQFSGIVIDIVSDAAGDRQPGQQPSLIDQRHQAAQRHSSVPLVLWIALGAGLLAIVGLVIAVVVRA